MQAPYTMSGARLLWHPNTQDAQRRQHLGGGRAGPAMEAARTHPARPPLPPTPQTLTSQERLQGPGQSCSASGYA